MCKSLSNNLISILHIYLNSKYWDGVPQTLKKKMLSEYSIPLFLIPIIFILKLTASYFRSLFSNIGTETNKLNSTIWVFVPSKNNYDALEFLVGSNPKLKFVAPRKLSFHPGFVFDLGYYKLKYKMFPALIWFPFVLLNMYSKIGSQVLRVWPIILNNIGQFNFAKYILSRYQPKAIIFANDHSPRSRALMVAAKSFGITTIYIQHACVTEFFPPLQHDFALLEGHDSRIKYEKIGNVRSQIKLIGMPKYDSYSKYVRTEKRKLKNIGLCYSVYTELDSLALLIKDLKNNFPNLRITIRPHPADNRHLPMELKNALSKNELSFSDSFKQKSFEFLYSQDIIIAGDSSVHLESNMLNIPSIYYSIDSINKCIDLYGFVKNGLVFNAPDFNILKGKISDWENNIPFVRDRTKRYNSVIDSEWDGRSSKLAKLELSKILEICLS